MKWQALYKNAIEMLICYISGTPVKSAIFGIYIWFSIRVCKSTIEHNCTGKWQNMAYTWNVGMCYGGDDAELKDTHEIMD